MGKKHLAICVITLLAIQLFFTGCESSGYIKDARQAEDQKDYYSAAYYYIQAVYWNKSNRLAQDKLFVVYPLAVEAELNQITGLKKEVISNYNQLMYHYKRLVTLQEVAWKIDKVTHYATGNLLISDENNYRTQMDGILEEAAEKHYKKAIEYSNSEEPDALHLALIEFEETLRYKQDYKDTIEKMRKIYVSLEGEEQPEVVESPSEEALPESQTESVETAIPQHDFGISIEMTLNVDEEIELSEKVRLEEIFNFDNLKQKDINIVYTYEPEQKNEYLLLLTVVKVENILNNADNVEETQIVPVKMHYSLKIYDSATGNLLSMYKGVVKNIADNQDMVNSDAFFKETLKEAEAEITAVLEQLF